VVATPLGNLRDVTLRALDVLATVDVVAAEDTRLTARLLAHYGIVPARMVSLHAHNEAQRAQAVCGWLREGRSVALVTDAGTPAVSDPGARVVRAARDAGFAVVPLPGPSAVAAAVSAAGLDAASFVFAGFPPAQAKARAAYFASLASIPAALVFYEAPHRVRATADDMAAAFGERRLVVARELTKTFETIAAMPLPDAAAWFAADGNRARGEFVLIVDAPVECDTRPAMTPDVGRWVAALVEELPPARAARVVANVTGVARDEAYALALKLSKGRKGS
jgi:16S rRNA (cytidine1402-2'-O)-methyltransferase